MTHSLRFVCSKISYLLLLCFSLTELLNSEPWYLAIDEEAQQEQNESTRGVEEIICRQKTCNNQRGGICAKLHKEHS